MDTRSLTPTPLLRAAGRTMAYGAGVAAGAYAACAAFAWLRYGHVLPATGDADPLLNRFMPEYEVIERHRVRVAAPAEVALAAARDVDLQRSPLVRAIFRSRELILGSEPDDAVRPRGLAAFAESIGWRMLADIPGREVVFGAVTQPWDANVVFRGMPADAFAAFDEPGYVKIAWTLAADPDGPQHSVVRTETRVMTTSADARRRFRWYWSRFSPGIVLIRLAALRLVRSDAESRAHAPVPAL